MIKLHYDRQEKILRLQRDNNELNALRMYTVEEAQEVYRLLGDWLAEKKATDVIGSAEAQRVAMEAGRKIPASTLINACARGTIPGAFKRKGRWYMPRENFDLWLQEWKIRSQEEQA